ncbi:4253_t:CDS:2 [Scutellospora calospora]|uniref:4253_t:CDS:1 n=1 Tax=Scutellospora calospora TaxID=85575 RepID=A0ACA9K5F4_9GLOM|nr:4253_t:CDS:2 [Scutellospora calospora]
MTIPDPIWILFSKLGYVPGFKQKRSKCDKCEQQINESLRAAQIHSVSNSSLPSALKLYKVNHITKAEQKLLELVFARSVFYCSLFLSLLEMETIKLLWKQARSAFKLPSRKKLSTKLLDFVFNETKNKVETLINQYTNMCLISDG